MVAAILSISPQVRLYLALAVVGEEVTVVGEEFARVLFNLCRPGVYEYYEQDWS